MCEKHLESAAANQKKYQNRMTTKGKCASCGKKLPPGRGWNCLRCKPTRDGKTRLQKRLDREKKLVLSESQLVQLRLRWNALIEGILRYHPNHRAVTILRMRCGINEEHDHTLKEVGDRFGITRERVRQIEKHVLGFALSNVRPKSSRK